MQRRNILKGIAIFGSYMSMLDAYACKDSAPRTIHTEKPDFPDIKIFKISKPGNYILIEDQIQKSRMRVRGGWMAPTEGGMLNILSGSVTLDLNGHTIGADLNKTGIVLYPSVNATFANNWPLKYAPDSLDSRFVSIKNGTVDLARGEFTGGAIDFSNRWGGQNQRTDGRPILGMESNPEVDYIKNEYTFEQMKILAHSIALAVEGTHTIIRNCVVESADLAAIFIAGDHALIENCEIRLRKPRRKRWEPRAAIVLRDGSNATIRNNVIRVDGGSDSESYGILVRDGALEVIIDNNTFVNTRENSIHLADGSTAIVRDNKFEKHWF